jgi:hypothetical protein
MTRIRPSRSLPECRGSVPFALFLVLMMASASHAQQDPAETNPDTPTLATSADDRAAEQQNAPRPEDERGFVAKARRWAEDTQIIERISGDVDGWYPRLRGMTRGSGFVVGPGYRTHLFDRRIFMDLSAGITNKAYKAVDANVRWWQGWSDRVEFWTDFRYEDFPQEDFFGRGLESPETARTSYDFENTDIAVRGVVTPFDWLRTGVKLGYMQPHIGRGKDRSYPSLEQLFTDTDAPGLLAQPDFVHTTFFVEVDTLDYPGNPRAGGFYRTSFGVWDDQQLDQFDHRRFDFVATHYVPLDGGKTHVISGRFGTAYVNNETGQRVPFYFLPYVGGRDTIRSFDEFRFKDENAAWISGEYSYRPIKWFSVAAFVDAGEVTPDWQDIDFRGMKTGYGFGVRVHSRTQNFMRIDVGTGGGEGWQFFLKLGPSF